MQRLRSKMFSEKSKIWLGDNVEEVVKGQVTKGLVCPSKDCELHLMGSKKPSGAWATFLEQPIGCCMGAKNHLDGLTRLESGIAVRRWWQTALQVRDIGGPAHVVATGMDDIR